MGVQTLNVLNPKIDQVLSLMANNQTAKERFDIGKGCNLEDYKRVVFLRRLLNSEDIEIQKELEEIQSKLNQIKNQYL